MAGLELVNQALIPIYAPKVDFGEEHSDQDCDV